MFKSEQTLSVPGDNQVVFESCVLALQDAKFRVKSANAQTGIVSGRSYKYRMDVSIQPGAGQCIVTATSEFSGVAITDYGISARNVDRFFNALMTRAAPLAGNPAALSAVQASVGSLPSERYSSNPMRKQVRETSIGKVMGWVSLIAGFLFLLGLILSMIAAANH